jgi:hypothetical protein
VILFLKRHGQILPDNGINELRALVFYEVEDAANADHRIPLYVASPAPLVSVSLSLVVSRFSGSQKSLLIGAAF